MHAQNQLAVLDAPNPARENGGYPTPQNPCSIEEFGNGQDVIKIGTYIIPGQGRDGTLEHLLLESIEEPKRACVDHFIDCVGVPNDLTANELAKMKMSSLAGASCHKNPWASVAYMFSDKGNPVSVDNACFKELADFLTDFSTANPPPAPAPTA